MDGISEQTFKAMNTITGVLNCSGFDYKGFAKIMCREHNTIQQNFMRAAYAFMEERAKESRFVDARNQATYNFCKKVTEVFEKDSEMVYFPYI